MKDKTIAAILAFFGGIVGLHRFYLGQKGLGFLHVAIFAMAMAAGPLVFFILALSLAMVFGVIDAISFLSMDQRSFDLKYNREVVGATTASSGGGVVTLAMSDRERRFQQRQRERAEKERERVRRAKEKSNQRTSYGKERKPAARRPSSLGRADREAGVRYFREYEYDRAIAAFRKALEKNPQDIASHFNIACTYSVEEEADKALYHLDRAVALGFDDFDRIRNHDSLAYLRVQPAYQEYVANGFRLTTVQPAPEAEADSEAVPPVEAPIEDDLLEQLQRLAALREKGLLTEVEFATQKRRLLG